MPEAEQEPFSQTPDERAKKHQQAQRALVIAYKRCFTTESGLRVLADLKQRFGWDRWEAEDTTDADVIARRCAAKGPIFHIERQLKTVFRKGKPIRRAGREPSP